MEEHPLWKPNQIEKKLRMPKLNLTNSTQNNDGDRDGARASAAAVSPPPQAFDPEKSKLNVAAPEFIPKCYLDKSSMGARATTSQKSVQDRLRVHKAPPEANLLVYDSIDERRLRQLITTLTNDPGQFDNLLDIFRQSIRPYFQDYDALSSVTDMLVKQAIDRQSFRYTAARLCYSIEQESPNFRAQLHITCERELARNSNKQGIVLFVAELYTQLYHENIYGKCLTNAFKQLLHEGGDDNIKCLCQALKLTGYSLEQYDRDALDDVMEQLVNIRHNVTGTALCLLDSVVNLRNAKWGYANNSESSSNNSEEGFWEEEEASVNTIFYNPDGNMLSTEETEFLASNLQSTDEYLIDASDPDELCDPEPEMDEEIQAAFREFVKLGKR